MCCCNCDTKEVDRLLVEAENVERRLRFRATDARVEAGSLAEVRGERTAALRGKAVGYEQSADQVARLVRLAKSLGKRTRPTRLANR